MTDRDSAPAALGDDAALRVGHMVLALGYGPRASWGVISALGPRWRTWRGGEIERLVRLDLTLYPGFSGGPLVDAGGRVVGLNTSGLARDARLAVPATTVTRVADELLRIGHVSRGYLGLGMQPVRLPEPLRARLGLPGEAGLIVVMVEPDGPAARAGVMLGDVLVALDGDARRRPRGRAGAPRLRSRRHRGPRGGGARGGAGGARPSRSARAPPGRLTHGRGRTGKRGAEPRGAARHAGAPAITR